MQLPTAVPNLDQGLFEVHCNNNGIPALSVLEYDLVVIGGGSGGLSCSKAASGYGARVALVDGVKPSPHGFSWGIGGTCANVGCIPKKLMHQAAIVGKEICHATDYGWLNVGKKEHSWETLVKVVMDRIKANSWIYRVQLKEKGVKLYTAFGSFIDNHTIKTISTDRRRNEAIFFIVLRAPKLVIATGLRPRYPSIPGAEHGITSDDLFWSPKPPGKTLVVGGSYVALEIAGLLADLGLPVDLLIRSRPLKSFDQDCVKLVTGNLKRHGVNIIYEKEVRKVELDGEKKKVGRLLFKMAYALASYITAEYREKAWNYTRNIWTLGYL
ncbi:pyridine nucleotide-disulfide oxidoreductase, partial [Necator americanus]